MAPPTLLRRRTTPSLLPRTLVHVWGPGTHVSIVVPARKRPNTVAILPSMVPALVAVSLLKRTCLVVSLHVSRLHRISPPPAVGLQGPGHGTVDERKKAMLINRLLAAARRVLIYSVGILVVHRCNHSSTIICPVTLVRLPNLHSPIISRPTLVTRHLICTLLMFHHVDSARRRPPVGLMRMTGRKVIRNNVGGLLKFLHMQRPHHLRHCSCILRHCV